MEDSKYVTWDVHKEFEKRVEAENKRQDARIGELESTVKEIGRLAVSVEKMAVSLEAMAAEQKRQGDRLTEMEQKPAKRWETVVGAIISGIVGILIGLISSGILR